MCHQHGPLVEGDGLLRATSTSKPIGNIFIQERNVVSRLVEAFGPEVDSLDKMNL